MAAPGWDRTTTALAAAGVALVVALPFVGNAYLVGVGLTVLMFEWWYYHRRTV